MSNSDSSNNPLFVYSIYPNQVFISTTTTLTLFISNPLDGDDVSIAKGRPEEKLFDNSEQSDEIDVYIPGTPGGEQGTPAGYLTEALNNVNCTSLSDGWGCTSISGSSGYYFKIYALGDTKLQPGDSIRIEFQTVQVNDTPGAPLIRIDEFIGDNYGSQLLTVQKLRQEVKIIAWADPSKVALNQISTINWSAWGGAYVTIAPDPLNPNPGQERRFPCQGSGVATGQIQVQVTPSQSQETFTLTVWTNDQQSAKDLVVVNVSKPLILSFSGAPTEPINLNESVTLQWNVKYANQVYLVSGGGRPSRVPLQKEQQVYPKDFLIGNQSSVIYTLQATGRDYTTQKPLTKSQTVNFKPVQILYFKYTDLTTKAFIYDTANALTVNISTPDSQYPDLLQLVAAGPGGPKVQYLGSGPYLQIQYFNASPLPIQPGQSSILSWVTLNADSVKLDPGNISVPSNAQGGGSCSVNPTQTTTYVLTARKGQETVTSQLMVVVQS